MSNEQVQDFARFIHHLREEVEKSRVVHMCTPKKIKIAEKFGESIYHDPSLYRDGGGRVFKVSGGGWFELVRCDSNDPFSTYRRGEKLPVSNAVVRVGSVKQLILENGSSLFLTQAADEFDQPWCWYHAQAWRFNEPFKRNGWRFHTESAHMPTVMRLRQYLLGLDLRTQIVTRLEETGPDALLTWWVGQNQNTNESWWISLARWLKVDIDGYLEEDALKCHECQVVFLNCGHWNFGF